jgi:hypothetical protein
MKTNINLDRPTLSNKRGEVRVLCSMNLPEYKRVSASVLRVAQDLYNDLE